MHVIAVINQKGGVGKTNVVGNLSAAWAERGRRVVVIDCDPQQTLTDWMLGRRASVKFSTADLFRRADEEEPALKSWLVEVADFGVRLLPSQFTALDQVQSDVNKNVAGAFDLGAAVATLENDTDIVLIDCPPNYGGLTQAAIFACTGVVVPIDCSAESVNGLSLLLQTIKKSSAVVQQEIPIHAVVATAFKSGNKFHPSIVDGVRQGLPDVPVFTIRDAIDVQRAVSANRPIRRFMMSAGVRNLIKQAVGSKTNAATDYDELAEALDKKLFAEVAHA
jgi:chromosome partitioning protein